MAISIDQALGLDIGDKIIHDGTGVEYSVIGVASDGRGQVKVRLTREGWADDQETYFTHNHLNQHTQVIAPQKPDESDKPVPPAAESEAPPAELETLPAESARPIRSKR